MTDLDARIAEVREEYTKFAKGNRAAFDRFSHRVTVLLAVLAVVQLALGVVAVKLTTSNSDRVSENRALIAKEKAARAKSILTSCQEANHRHDVAAGYVAALTAATPASKRPHTEAERRAQTRSIELFDEAIAPQYLAGKGTLAQRRAAGCAARLAKFSEP